MITDRKDLPKDLLLSPETAMEIDNFEAEMNRFIRGELAPERWRSFRLAHGVYGQRQPDVQMVRVKIPSGVVTDAQLHRLADVSEAFSTGISHLTTSRRHLAKPVLRAEEKSDGFVLDGFSPWVTGSPFASSLGGVCSPSFSFRSNWPLKFVSSP